MAQTQQPDDEGARGAAAPGGAAGPRPGDGDAATAGLPPVLGAPGGPQTPGRGTAAPLGTVGDGRYRMTHRLGRGGMAEVFAAQDVRLGRTVAVKLLRGELAQDDVARLRFTREAHAVAALNHHSIVSVYDTGEEHFGEESTPYIVMELVEGRTVRELLVDEEAPPVDQALIIIAGVLEALAYSHRNGIVHRDIKPANVIITTGGAVKVMDFGIARALTGAATTMTQTGMVMGTPQYLSPEQALGKPVDHRSDLYAAGCMLYELLTLRPPFTGDTPLSVVYQHVQDPPVPPSQANHRVPPGLDPLVLRALAKNPDDRYQSADEFRAHLQHSLREMHGAAGAGWAEGAAAAGLMAAGQGTGGTPRLGDSGETAITTPYGPAGAADPTAMLPYHVPGGQTPASPYPGAGGPYGGDGGGHDDDGYGGDGSRRRRGPWAWAAGFAAVFVAAGVGIALALSGNGGGGGQQETPAPTVPVATSPSASQTTPGPQPTPTGSATPSSRKPQQPSDNNLSPYPTGTGGNKPSPSATGTGSKSPTATGTGSKSPTATPSQPHSPSGGASTPAGGGGGATTPAVPPTTGSAG